MNRFFENKIGADKVISIYWFAIIVIIAGGVFGMAYNFYGSPYDVREIESEVLSNKVADCISSQGYLNENLFNLSNGNFTKEFQENFFDICNLNFDTSNENGLSEGIQYFTEARFYNLRGEELFLVEEGNLNFRSDCALAESDREYEKIVKCVEKRFYAVSPLDSNGQYLIKIVSAVGKTEKNVKL